MEENKRILSDIARCENVPSLYISTLYINFIFFHYPILAGEAYAKHTNSYPILFHHPHYLIPPILSIECIWMIAGGLYPNHSVESP